MSISLLKRGLRWLAIVAAVLPSLTLAQAGHPNATELPAFFSETFLNFPEDAADAAKAKKRLFLFYGQEGCPYCKEMIQTNFTQRDIVARMKTHFVAIGLDLWGDRETTWFDGKTRSEKELAKFLKVQFTPTVLLLDEKGAIIGRINGYYPPHRLAAALDYASGRQEGKLSFAEHMKKVPQQGASPSLNEEPFFIKPPGEGKPLDLRRAPGAKPLAVLFESRHCAPCDELHKEGFKREKTLATLKDFDVARFSISGRDPVITPDGTKTDAESWARKLGISYTPSVVFFADGGKEVFRLEAYLRPFHFTSSFEYVGSGAYRKEPEFQRFLQNKAELMKEHGEKLELWK